MRVVLLHAFPLDATMWEPQLPALAEHDVERFDLYSLGGNSMEAWAAAILERVDGEFVAVGASMGGYVALELARQAPERVRALVLAGARAGADSEERREIRNAMIEVLREEGLAPFVEAAPFAVPPGHTGDDFIRALEAMRDRRDSTDVVRSFDGPLLVVVGSEDELVSAEEATEIAAAARNGRAEVVAGAGHIVSQDAPERFNELLLEFLGGLRG